MNLWRTSLALAAGLLLLNGVATAPARPVVAQACSWTGVWDAGGYGMLEMGQTGDIITGTYTYSGRQGRLIGQTDADDAMLLLGKWTEEPASEGKGSGLFAFKMIDDCSAFGGAYGYGDSTQAAGEWSAKRVR